MLMKRIHAISVIALSLPLTMSGQSIASRPQTGEQLLPTLVAQPASLSPSEVERMRVKLKDWPNLARYRAADARLPAPALGEKRVVFLGDSITDRWGRKVGTFFPGEPYINRGISGQTTPQMLIRFQQDVVHLHPQAVIVLAGTNDIAQNTGPSTPEMIEDNLASMAAIARHYGIKMIIASILPAARYPWRPKVNGVQEIRDINRWLKSFCEQNRLVYLDYYSALVDDAGGMRPGLSSDGVHPTARGYEIMAPLAAAAIRKALTQR